jgi:carbon-monoxide dehydrogenase small subunit
MHTVGQTMRLDNNDGQDLLAEVSFQVNGESYVLMVPPWESALHVLREQLGLIGSKEGCGIGECGACTIIVDGRAVNACLLFAPQLDGCDVETIEGFGQAKELHPLQQSFLEHGAVQCGFCTPGMLMSAKALLDGNSAPSRTEIVEAIAGNLCRCTGYQQIITAIESAVSDPDQS